MPHEQRTVGSKGQFRLGDRPRCHLLTLQDDAMRYGTFGAWTSTLDVDVAGGE